MTDISELSPIFTPGRKPTGNRSLVVGDTTEPLLQGTISQALAATEGHTPNAEAAVFAEAGVRWTYREFAQEVDRLAAGFRALGLEKGDRLGVWAPNRPEWLLCQFATARIGVILVNINPAYRSHELEYALKKVGCKALVTAARFKSSDYIGMLQKLIPELDGAPGALHSERLPDLRAVIRMGAEETRGMLNFDDVLALGDDPDVAALNAIGETLDPHDAINIQFTSGTTGNPKGATLTHYNILNNARLVARQIRMTERDRIVIPVPFYHCFGMVMGTLACVTQGACMVMPSEGFDPEATLRAASREHGTAVYGVPTMFVAMLDELDKGDYDLSTLRTGIMAGAPCPVEVMKRVQHDMNMHEVTIAYGMTETSPVSFQSDTDDPLEKRVTTVGRILPHLQVKIVDEEGRIAPVGRRGELWTKGFSVMRGYWDEPEKTAEAVVGGGWMRTGDLAVMDDEGYVNIVGRVKDMILRGGENIYPREIEEFLFTHPAVAQVQVFGVPDDRLGEIVCAWIVLKEGASATEQEIREFCKEQIAHFKVPAHVRFKKELPVTVTGKPQKFIMSAEMAKELGVTAQKTA